MFGLEIRGGMAVFLAVLMLSACGEKVSVSEHMARARDYVAKDDYNAASIELRNVIQQSPENMDARMLLGQVYFKIGDMPSAEKELQRVLQSNAPVDKNELLPMLARVWLKLGKNEQSLSIDTQGLDSDSVATILATQAIMHMSLSQADLAASKMKLALDLSPDLTIVLDAQARYHFFLRELNKADKLLLELHKRAPDDASLWALHGDVRQYLGDFNLAEDYYSRAIALDDTSGGLDFRMRRAQLRIQEKEYDDAQIDIDFLLEFAPQNTQVNYAQGLIFFFNNKYQEAISSFVVAEPDKFRFPEVLMYLGFAHYQIGNLDQAYGYAQDFYAIETNNPDANKLLSTLWVVNGKYAEAEQLIRTVLARYPNDTNALNILASTLSNQQRVDEAIEVLAEIVALNPDSAEAQVRLSVGYTRAGRSNEAVETVHNAIELDPEFNQADVVLVLTYLKQNNYDGALETAQAYQQRNPGEVAPLLLLARVYLEQGSSNAAHQTFVEVLELDPGNPSANHRLAAMAGAAKDPAAAKSYYGAVLKEHPHFLSTLVALAFLEGSENNFEAMVSYLEEAIEAHPAAIQPKVILARYYLTAGRADKVPVTLSGLSESQNDTPVVLRLMGKSQLAEKKYADARYSLELLIDLENERATAEDYRLLAMAYKGLGDKQKMEASMQQALAKEPDSLESHLSMAADAFSRADAQEFEQHLAAAEKISPDNAQLLKLNAAYARVQGDQQEALRLFEQLFKTEPTTANMLNLHNQYELAGDQSAARSLLQSWVKEYADDNVAKFELAKQYLAEGDTKLAVQEYTSILENDANSLVALNNLAWLLKDEDPKLALGYAERAADIASKSIEVLDTLAVLQSANGQFVKANTSIQQVLNVASKNPTYLYHRALIAYQSGDRDEAIKTLRDLLSGSEDFSERDEAIQLMESLSVD